MAPCAAPTWPPLPWPFSPSLWLWPNGKGRRPRLTTTGGLFLGFDRATAARLSFLLSVPAVLLSGGYKLVKDANQLLGDQMVATGVATVVSFVVGYAAIAFLMKFLQTRSTMIFVVYRLILAAVLVFMASRGMIAG